MPVDLPPHVPPQAIPTDHREQAFLPGPIAMWQLKKSLLVGEAVFVQEGVPIKQLTLRTPIGRFLPVSEARPATFGHLDAPFGVAVYSTLPADAKRDEITLKVREMRDEIKPMLHELARLYVVAAPPDPSARLFG